VSSALHRARLDAVTHELLASGAHRVVDLGCGQGELLQALRSHPQFTFLLGIDIDAEALAHGRSLLGLDLFRPNDRLHVCLGSFEASDWDLPRVDVAVMLETIEHVDAGRLPCVERTVFQALRPRLVLITTPNSEYNPVHGLPAGQRRHPDHRFEWTRKQFQRWCQGVTERHRYGVRFVDIGPPHPHLGSSTQMACFTQLSKD
jgi:3' terminal RNA ribose 2'-O-methyltransferase Hen1